MNIIYTVHYALHFAIIIATFPACVTAYGSGVTNTPYASILKNVYIGVARTLASPALDLDVTYTIFDSYKSVIWHAAVYLSAI